MPEEEPTPALIYLSAFLGPRVDTPFDSLTDEAWRRAINAVHSVVYAIEGDPEFSAIRQLTTMREQQVIQPREPIDLNTTRLPRLEATLREDYDIFRIQYLGFNINFYENPNAHNLPGFAEAYPQHTSDFFQLVPLLDNLIESLLRQPLQSQVLLARSNQETGPPCDVSNDDHSDDDDDDDSSSSSPPSADGAPPAPPATSYASDTDSYSDNSTDDCHHSEHSDRSPPFDSLKTKLLPVIDEKQVFCDDASTPSVKTVHKKLRIPRTVSTKSNNTKSSTSTPPVPSSHPAKNFENFVQRFIDTIDNPNLGESDDAMDFETFKARLRSPPVNAPSLQRLINLQDTLSTHGIVLNRNLNHLQSAAYRHHPHGIPDWFSSSRQCQSYLNDLDHLKDRKITRGLTRKRRNQVVDHAKIDSLTSFYRLQNEILRLQHYFYPKAAPTKRKCNYDLKSLGLEHLSRHVKKGRHLTIDAAFSAQQLNQSRSQFNNHSAILDTGASKHFITHHLRHLLINQRPSQSTMVNANGGTTVLTQAGDFSIKLQDADGASLGQLPIHGASIVPDSDITLLSVNQLLMEGAEFTLSALDGNVMRYQGNAYSLYTVDGLMILDLMAPLIARPLDSAFMSHIPTSRPADEDNYSNDIIDSHSTASTPPVHRALLAHAATMETWHERLAHVDKRRINMLNINGNALGLDVKGSQFSSHNNKCKCEVCMKTNNVHRSVGKFREFADQVSRPGELITSDVIGPFPPTSEGHRYAISFVDEFTRYSNVYLMKHKSEAPAALTTVIKFYKSYGIIIARIRSDQGGEYGGHHARASTAGGPSQFNTTTDDAFLSPAFQQVCTKNHIKAELTPAHRPELHGVAERWNRTVMTMANSMMYKARISPVLWSSAVAHANMIRNRLPLTSRGGHTPFELFTNRRPRYENLRVWGCYCYKLLPNAKKIPGLPLRQRLIYVGETPDRIGFRVFNPLTYAFTTEYELIFDEEGINNRASLLEKFDTRRKDIQDKVIESIPLIVSLDPSPNHHRTVYASSELPPPAPQRPEDASDGRPMTTPRQELITSTVAQSLLSDNGLCPQGTSGGDHSTSTTSTAPTSSRSSNLNTTSTSTRPANATRSSRRLNGKEPALMAKAALSKVPATDTTTSVNTVSNSTTRPITSLSPPMSDVDQQLLQAQISWKISPITKTSPESSTAVSSQKTPSNNDNRTSSSPEASATSTIPNATPIENVMGYNYSLDDFVGIEHMTSLLHLRAALQDQQPRADAAARNALSASPSVTPQPQHQFTYGSTLKESSSTMRPTSGEQSDFHLLPDIGADRMGPLLSETVNRNNLRFEYDFSTTSPMCPQRYQSPGTAQPITSEFTRFLKLAKSCNAKISIQQHNPKRIDTPSYDRYEIYKHATTVGAFFSKFKTHTILNDTEGFKDLQWDAARGYITFPNNTSGCSNSTTLPTFAALYCAYHTPHVPSSPSIHTFDHALLAHQPCQPSTLPPSTTVPDTPAEEPTHHHLVQAPDLATAKWCH